MIHNHRSRVRIPLQMQHYLHNAGVQKLQQSLPLLLVMGSIVVLVFVIYGVATARTANREISKLNWKPNS